MSKIEQPAEKINTIRKDVIKLCTTVGKPILKLTDADYHDHDLDILLNKYESAYRINIQIFNELQHTITGWPGGKPGADDTNRPERAEPPHKRIVIFSPHPDDDVISMGGTLIRLVDQGHEVHVAYQTSGAIAVFDEDVMQFADFFQSLASELGDVSSISAEFFNQVRSEITAGVEGQSDGEAVRTAKTLIRVSEAKAACRMIGVPDENIHFLNMPFYHSGEPRKLPLGPHDIDLNAALLNRLRPHQIYAAGDLADPHGTHEVCLRAIYGAIQELSDSDWLGECRFWLYRGAWHEWPIDEIDMAVPMSPDEVKRKRQAIFKHQSQKDTARFPGDDNREFWQRAESRNRRLAERYDALGLAEYEAMEAFKRIDIEEILNDSLPC
jgi:glucosamine-6-phosphate deaminase